MGELSKLSLAPNSISLRAKLRAIPLEANQQSIGQL